MDYVKVIRRGEQNTRVLLADGSTRLVRNSELASWTKISNRNSVRALQALKFGMEFECLIPCDKVSVLETRLRSLLGTRFAGNSHSYHVTQYSKWQWGTDASIHGPSGYSGVELKSPILGIENQSDYAELKSVLALVNELGGKVNKSTGTHVHLSFGNQRVTDNTAHMLFDCYGRWENAFFDRVVAPSRRNNNYCKSCNDHRYEDRYHKLNIHALRAYGTLEFRQHQGTLSYNKIVSWLGVAATWVKVMTSRNYPTPANFDDALNILGLSPALRGWAQSRYEDFNE